MVKAKKNCEICGKIFRPSRKWQKYCSEKCREEAKRKRAMEWYEKNRKNGILGGVTLKDLMEKMPYAENTHRILFAFKLAKDMLDEANDEHERKWLETQGIQEIENEPFPALSFSAFKKLTELPEYTLSRYLRKLCEFGVISKTGNRYRLTPDYSCEPLKDMQIGIMKQSAANSVLISPFFITYFRNFNIDELDDEDKEDYKRLEKFFFIGFMYFSRWLSSVQNKKYAREFYSILEKYNLPPIMRLYIWIVVNLGNAFCQFMPVLMGRVEMDEVLAAIINGTLISLIHERYSVQEEKIFHDFLDVYKKYREILNEINNERQERLNRINEMEAILATLPIREVRKKFVYEEPEFYTLGIRKAVEKLEDVVDIAGDFKKERVIKELEELLNFNFDRYWNPDMMEKVFSENYFLKNIWNFEEWKDVRDVFIEAFGRDFIDIWKRFLIMLDYWATVFPMPSLPEKYEDLFKRI